MEFLCRGGGLDSLEHSYPDKAEPITAELLSKLLNAPNIGFAMVDEGLRYVYVNEALARMHGLPATGHYGKTVRDVLGDGGSRVEDTLRKTFTTGESFFNFEFSATLPNRSDAGHWVGNYFPIAQHEGKMKRVGVIVVELGHVQMRRNESGNSEAEARRLEAFLEFSGSTRSTQEEPELIPLISAFVHNVVPHDFGNVAIHDKGIGRLRIYGLNNSSEDEWDGEDTVLPTIESVYGATFLHGDIKVHNRITLETSDLPLFKRLLKKGIQSVCLLPLISRKGTLGTLTLGRKEENGFHRHDTIFLRQVAAQVALALDNAAAHREIRELTQRLNKENIYLQEEVRSAQEFDDIIGESPALQRVLGQVHTVAPSDATVLILGETGTGKELIARAIHRLSSRKGANFIKLNCAAIPTGLLESELFGHEKGAFTGAITQKIGRLELADKGTLFLDEVGEIQLELQPKLLRVLQDQEFERLGGTRTIKVDIRLIAATNRDLAKSVQMHEFRSDLFYRIHVFPVHLPPLRDRHRDIPLLVRYFVEKFVKRMNKHIDAVPEEAMRALQSWIWPGNVRELENFIERSVILTQGKTLTVPMAELRSEIDSSRRDSTLESLEREHILRVLRETGGVIAGLHGAAARLGMKRTTLQSRMQKLGITREEYQN